MFCGMVRWSCSLDNIKKGGVRVNIILCLGILLSIPCSSKWSSILIRTEKNPFVSLLHQSLFDGVLTEAIILISFESLSVVLYSFHLQSIHIL